MKKILIIAILSILAISCSNNNLEKVATDYLTENGYQKIENMKEVLVKNSDTTKKVFVGYATKDDKNYSIYLSIDKEDKVAELIEIEDIYTDFEIEEANKFEKNGIEIVSVETSAKNLSIRLVTKNEKFSQEEFEKIAIEIANDFKTKYDKKDISINVYMDLDKEGSEYIFLFEKLF